MQNHGARMKIRLLKHWNGYKPGKLFDMPDGQANLLLRRGVAELQDQIETPEREEVETAARRPGRPRKLQPV